ILSGHSDYFDFIPNGQRRRFPLDDAGRREGELELILQVAIPAQCALLFVIGINDDFVGDALLALLVSLWSAPGHPSLSACTSLGSSSYLGLSSRSCFARSSSRRWMRARWFSMVSPASSERMDSA